MLSARSEGSNSPYLNQLLSHQKLGDSAMGQSPSIEVNIEDLWRFGIPVSVRRVLWPFKIGNKLGISKELYQINKAQGFALRQKVLS